MSIKEEDSLPGRGNRVAIHTLGCRLNQAETRLIEEQLRQAGYVLTPFDVPADWGIVHTCVVTHEAEAKSRKIIRRFLRANPEAQVAVIGCYAQTHAAALAAMPGVHLVLGNAAKFNLVEHLQRLSNGETHVDAARPKRGTFILPFSQTGPPITRRINLKIQDGCDFMCRYCYIPFARGRSRSRSFEDILAEVSSLMRRGAREIILAGVNIGDYYDGDHGLIHLADQLNENHPGLRLRISSLELTNAPAALLPRMADPTHILTPHLHIPLQSGSARILAAMGRPYTPEHYLQFLQQANDAVPGIGLGADVMVGFPGETEEDFENTCALIRQSPLSYLHVFQYSERKAVVSARLPDKVPAPIMKKRSQTLLLLHQQKRTDFQQQWMGREVEVLFESQSEGHWIGHTGNYLEVAVSSGQNLANVCAIVKITSMGKNGLLGQLIDTYSR